MAVREDETMAEISYENIIAVFRDHDDPALTAGEVAAHFPVTRQAVNKRLTTMVERGTLERKKVGGAAVVYWLTG